jgi:hypothetical protein
MLTDIMKDHPLLVWLEHDRQTYLTELIRWEGRGGSSEICPGCKTEAARFRCDDCTDMAMYCQDCTLARHCQHPLHRLKVCLKSYGQKIRFDVFPRNGPARFSSVVL